MRPVTNCSSVREPKHFWLDKNLIVKNHSDFEIFKHELADTEILRKWPEAPHPHPNRTSP